MEKIAVKKLTAQIEGKTILQDISFEVEAGQSLVIIGESGSGKTLLTKILIGQLPVHPFSGLGCRDGRH